MYSLHLTGTLQKSVLTLKHLYDTYFDASQVVVVRLYPFSLKFLSQYGEGVLGFSITS